MPLDSGRIGCIYISTGFEMLIISLVSGPHSCRPKVVIKNQLSLLKFTKKVYQLSTKAFSLNWIVGFVRYGFRITTPFFLVPTLTSNENLVLAEYFYMLVFELYLYIRSEALFVDSRFRVIIGGRQEDACLTNAVHYYLVKFPAAVQI